MSEDIEALLRSGMAERVERAPVFDDPGLADAAIAGAGRLRRRRRAGAAASGAGLLVLGAAAFVWHPWSAQVQQGDDVLASDTTAAEAQREFDMEFVVESDGLYEVINSENERIAIGDQEPYGVYRLNASYLAEDSDEVWTTSFDGTSGMSFPKPSQDETYLRINDAGEQFAMITPTDQYTAEEYTLVDVAEASQAAQEAAVFEPVSFTTGFDLSLTDWTDATAVFSADLHSVTAGNPGSYWFNAEFDWGMDSVAAAGFDAAVIIDATDPNYLCVEDLDPGVGVVSTQEVCGPAESAEVEEYLAVASTGASDPLDISAKAVVEMDSVFPAQDADLGEYRNRFMSAEYWWSDPLNRWQMTAAIGADTWLLLDTTGDEPTLSELPPPRGAIMPVLSYT